MIRTTVLQSLIVSESISLKNCSQSIRAPLPLWLSSQFGKGHTRDEGENRLSKHNVLRSLKKLTLPQDYWDTTRLLRHTWKLPIRCLKSSLSTKSCWLNSWVPRVLDDSTLVSGFHTLTSCLQMLTSSVFLLSHISQLQTYKPSSSPFILYHERVMFILWF